MMNPIKKIKNIDDSTKLALAFDAMYLGAAVIATTVVAAGAATVAYGAVKVANHVSDDN